MKVKRIKGDKNHDKDMARLYGPFSQVVTMDGLPEKGRLKEDDLEIIPDAGIVVKHGMIAAVGAYDELRKAYGMPHNGYESTSQEQESLDKAYGSASVREHGSEKLPGTPATGGVVVPGLVDAHTHICWAGSRYVDYAKRLSGRSYAEIAGEGGGIWSTVLETRKAGMEELAGLTTWRADQMTRQGITTIEVKSGYGLDTESELRMLESIRLADRQTAADLIPTCLAAHSRPRDFSGTSRQYLDMIVRELLPMVLKSSLSQRVDIYVDDHAFSSGEARGYLSRARELGFDILLHGDQFSRGGVMLAAELSAVSADHLEVSEAEDIAAIAASHVVPVLLPGASLGLGADFAPARRLLDAGASLVIASDWNPGSAPMGHLLVQAAVLAIYEKLTMAETWAAVTCRAARVLGLGDRGILRPGMKADFVEFPCRDYREILYRQGNLPPIHLWKNGEWVF